jgi:broad specificity phosphatase PhoE
MRLLDGANAGEDARPNMAYLYLVRNARTEEGAGFEVNPRLDEVGQEQAEAVQRALGPFPPMRIFCSPQRRAIETAAPLARYWRISPMIDETIALMPLPSEQECDRAAWLVDFMKGKWSTAPAVQRRWRESCLERLAAFTEDTVIFTHFVVVNTFVGAALDDDRVSVFQFDNGSVTALEITDRGFKLIERGRQAATWLL